MIILKRAEQRRHIENNDQNTWLTFDKENKADPLKDGFGSLILFNEEILTRDRALKLHPHQDLVVVTYVQQGVVVYHGPFGGSDLLEPGNFHRINVGPGDQPYKFDGILFGDTHLFQSGFIPDLDYVEPRGKKIFFSHADRHGILRLIASPDGRESSLSIQRDVHMYSTYIHQGNHIDHPIKHGRSIWLHLVMGRVLVWV
jgi:quercetin 2,3-dioxygenase